MNIITVPFAALLRWFYEFTSSYGLSIILFALVIKRIFLPFQMKGKKGMMRMGALSKRHLRSHENAPMSSLTSLSWMRRGWRFALESRLFRDVCSLGVMCPPFMIILTPRQTRPTKGASMR